MRVLVPVILAGVVAAWSIPVLGQVVVDMPPPPAASADDAVDEGADDEMAPDPALRRADVGWVAINRYAGYRTPPRITTAHGPSLYSRPFNRVYYGPAIGPYWGYPFFGGFFGGTRFFHGHHRHGFHFGHGFHGRFGFHGSGIKVRIRF